MKRLITLVLCAVLLMPMLSRAADAVAWKSETPAPVQETAQDALEYVRSRVAAGDTDIDLRCTDALYHYLLGSSSDSAQTGQGNQPLLDLTANAGIYRVGLFLFPDTRCITIHAEQLYPGTQILLHKGSSTLFPLSAREQALMEAADKLTAQCLAETQTQTARNIHDTICRLVTYESLEGETENDTAIGALLNGRADCDGYADAFFLMANLAGLDARYQRGTCNTTGYQALINNNSAHMWNVVNIDDTWRMVDVTFDDEAGGFGTVWFNAGADLAGRMHSWIDVLSVELAPQTSLDCRLPNEFYLQSPAELQTALQTAAQNRLPSLKLILMGQPTGTDFSAAALEAVSSTVTGTFRYSWEKSMQMFSASELTY